MCHPILDISLELSCKGSVECCTPLHNIMSIDSYIGIPCHSLLTWKMDLKTNNIRFLFIHLKVVYLPVSLTGRDIACIKILLDFIRALTKLHGDSVMTLIDILVDILDSLDRSNGLNINVMLVLFDQVFAVANNPTVVNLFASDFMHGASVTASHASI